MWQAKRLLRHHALFFSTLIMLLAISRFPAGYAADAPNGTKAGSSSFVCAENAQINIVDKTYEPGGWNFNREVVANSFALFAAASYDAYEPRDDGKSRSFRFDDAHPDLQGAPIYGKTGWRRAEERHSYKSGLSYDVYYRDVPDHLAVLVSYRGTDEWLNVDLIANLSWITQWINPWDQYRQARHDFDDVVSRAVKAANGRPVAFIVTGHSLGGGLAQYVAHTHPCTAAVVFNSSPVTNTWLTRSRNDAPRVIRIYVKGDAFEMVAGGIVNETKEAIYRFERRLFDPKKNSEPEFVYQHNMEAVAAVLSRMAVECTLREDCKEISDNAATSRILYCARYWGYRWNVQPGLKDKTFDEICR